jgi:hypothetical protein
MTHPHHITDAADAHAFIFGGRARFTLVSKVTGKRYTYRVAKAKDSDTMFFLSLLTGPSNEDDYTYLGHIRTGGTHSVLTSSRKDMGKNFNHPAFLAMDWMLRQIENSNPLQMPVSVEFWHEGRCAKCARPLTDPASIARGLGPECASKGL